MQRCASKHPVRLLERSWHLLCPSLCNTHLTKCFGDVSSAAAQRLGIMRKSWQLFHDQSLLLRSSWSFVLPVLECCSAVWCSAADSHLKLLDKFVRSAGFLASGILDWHLVHRRSAAELCMLFNEE